MAFFRIAKVIKADESLKYSQILPETSQKWYVFNHLIIGQEANSGNLRLVL